MSNLIEFSLCYSEKKAETGETTRSWLLCESPFRIYGNISMCICHKEKRMDLGKSANSLSVRILYIADSLYPERVRRLGERVMEIPSLP